MNSFEGVSQARQSLVDGRLDSVRRPLPCLLACTPSEAQGVLGSVKGG